MTSMTRGEHGEQYSTLSSELHWISPAGSFVFTLLTLLSLTLETCTRRSAVAAGTQLCHPREGGRNAPHLIFTSRHAGHGTWHLRCIGSSSRKTRNRRRTHQNRRLCHRYEENPR